MLLKLSFYHLKMWSYKKNIILGKPHNKKEKTVIVTPDYDKIVKAYCFQKSHHTKQQDKKQETKSVWNSQKSMNKMAIVSW